MSRDGGFQAMNAAGNFLQIRTLLLKLFFYRVNFETF
jgi:hypothetical protein